jgi:hypothetical protein
VVDDAGPGGVAGGDALHAEGQHFRVVEPVDHQRLLDQFGVSEGIVRVTVTYCTADSNRAGSLPLHLVEVELRRGWRIPGS